MPHYYFDIFNAECDRVDVGGQDLEDDDAARCLALRTLAELAHQDIRRGGDAQITVRVRLRGVPIYSASMTLSDQWIRLGS